MRASLWRARAAPRCSPPGRDPAGPCLRLPEEVLVPAQSCDHRNAHLSEDRRRKATAEELERITENLMAEIYRLGEGLE